MFNVSLASESKSDSNQGKFLKILHTITTINLGGAENHLAKLIKGQINEGHEVSVLYLKGDGHWKEYYRSLGVKCHHMGLRNYLDIFALVRLARHIHRIKPNTVHAHLPPAELFTRAALYLCSKRIKFFITKHNDEPFAPILGWTFLARWVAKRSQKIIAISQAVRRYSLEHWATKEDGKKIETICYGIDAFDYEMKPNDPALNGLRREWKIPEDCLIIGTVARLTPQKSLDTLIQAYAQFSTTNPNTRLVIVGVGPLETELKNLCLLLNISDKVIWAGTRRDIPLVMNLFDVFVLPSIYEGFGLVLLEAMAAKKPIIASNVSAIPETVSHGVNGLLFEKKNVDQLFEALTQLHCHEKRKKMGEAGRKNILENFQLDHMIRHTLASYERH